jgi:hypothetical protein
LRLEGTIVGAGQAIATTRIITNLGVLAQAAVRQGIASNFTLSAATVIIGTRITVGNPVDILPIVAFGDSTLAQSVVTALNGLRRNTGIRIGIHSPGLDKTAASLTIADFTDFQTIIVDILTIGHEITDHLTGVQLTGLTSATGGVFRLACPFVDTAVTIKAGVFGIVLADRITFIVDEAAKPIGFFSQGTVLWTTSMTYRIGTGL